MGHLPPGVGEKQHQKHVGACMAKRLPDGSLPHCLPRYCGDLRSANLTRHLGGTHRSSRTGRGPPSWGQGGRLLADLPFPAMGWAAGGEQCWTLLQITHWVTLSWLLSPHIPEDIVNVRLLQGSRPLTLEHVWEQPFPPTTGCQLESKARAQGWPVGGEPQHHHHPAHVPPPHSRAIADLSK